MTLPRASRACKYFSLFFTLVEIIFFVPPYFIETSFFENPFFFDRLVFNCQSFYIQFSFWFLTLLPIWWLHKYFFFEIPNRQEPYWWNFEIEKNVLFLKNVWKGQFLLQQSVLVTEKMVWDSLTFENMLIRDSGTNFN